MTSNSMVKSLVSSQITNKSDDYVNSKKALSARELRDPHVFTLDFSKQSGRSFKVRQTDNIDFYAQGVPKFLSSYRSSYTPTISRTPRDSYSSMFKKSQSDNSSQLNWTEQYDMLHSTTRRIPDLARSTGLGKSRFDAEHPELEAVDYFYEKPTTFARHAKPVDPVSRKRYKFDAQTSRQTALHCSKNGQMFAQCGPDQYYDKKYTAIDSEAGKGFKFTKSGRNMSELKRRSKSAEVQ